MTEDRCTSTDDECCYRIYDFYNVTEHNIEQKKREFLILTHPDRYATLNQDERNKLENLKLIANSTDIFKFKNSCFEPAVFKASRYENKKSYPKCDLTKNKKTQRVKTKKFDTNVCTSSRKIDQVLESFLPNKNVKKNNKFTLHVIPYCNEKLKVFLGRTWPMFDKVNRPRIEIEVVNAIKKKYARRN